MLKRFRRAQPTSEPELQSLTPKKLEFPTVRTGRALLSSTNRQELVSKIKRLFSVTEPVWNQHYLYAIEQFAELVQEVPASEIHHHSEAGGLIDHTLEALHAGVRISQGYILPPNAEPESIAESADRWRFAAFIAILGHDIGKIVTDIEVVYRKQGSSFERWHPWYGNLPPGAEYQYRFKKKIENSRLAKTLHEKSGMSLLPRLLTKEAAEWIFTDLELVSQLFSTISHSSFGGHVISEIVRAADGASVSQNLGARTGRKTDHSSAVPLHEKFIVSLRKLISDGTLKRNRPGATIWTTDNDTWAVSKTAMEAVRAQLINEGHSGIPKSVVTMFGILKDHDCIVQNGEEDSIWFAEVNDHAKNWQQKLTFLRFKNEIIWPTSQPDLFDGTITPIDRQGNPLAEQPIEPSQPGSTEPVSDQEAIGLKLEMKNIQEVTANITVPQPAKQKVEQPATKKTPKQPVPAEKTAESTSKPQDITPANAGVSSEVAVAQWKTKRDIQEDILKETDFFNWLLRGISRRNIRVNEPKAPVHILENHVALVTPAIFNLFLDKNALKKRLYEKRAGDKRIYTVLQREIEQLDIHQKGMNGQNIVTVTVEGPRSSSELKVYLLNRKCFPSLSSFSPNPAIKIFL